MHIGGWAGPRRGKVIAAVAAASVLLTLVSAAPGARAADYQEVRYEHWVDPSRPTPPNGTYPGTSSRSIDIRFLVPPGNGPFPLVIYSHGQNGTMEGSDALLRPLEKAGYLVAIPDYPYARLNPPGGLTGIDRVNETKDETFVLDKILDVSEHFTGWLGGLVDATRVAAAGQSRGGYTTLGLFNSCCRDDRFKAVIMLSAALDGRDDFKGTWLPNPPFLGIAGDADSYKDLHLYDTNHAFFATTSSPTYFITALGADHTDPLNPRLKWAGWVADAMVGFLDTYVRADPTGPQRLGNGGNHPGATRCEGCKPYRETPTTDLPSATTSTTTTLKTSKPTLTTKKPALKVTPKATATTTNGAAKTKPAATKKTATPKRPAKTGTPPAKAPTTTMPPTSTTETTVLSNLEIRIPGGARTDTSTTPNTTG